MMRKRDNPQKNRKKEKEGFESFNVDSLGDFRGLTPLELGLIVPSKINIKLENQFWANTRRRYQKLQKKLYIEVGIGTVFAGIIKGHIIVLLKT